VIINNRNKKNEEIDHRYLISYTDTKYTQTSNIDTSVLIVNSKEIRQFNVFIRISVGNNL